MSDNLFKSHKVPQNDTPKFKLSVKPTKPRKKYKLSKTEKKIKAKYLQNKSHKFVSKDKWLETHKDYLRWRKTPEFEKWRYRQFLRQGGTCWYCDLPIFYAVRQNIDHVIPKIRGGGNNKNNLVIACAECNKNKNYDLLSHKERKALKEKNKKKKGTYHQTLEQYSEETLAYKLKEMFRED